MKYLLGMGYSNRPDLLHKALASVKPFWERMIVIDNSECCALRNDPARDMGVRIYEPPVPLTFPQMINYLRRLAEEDGCDVVLYMHNDAEAHPGTLEALLRMVESLQRSERKWGAVFTNFDILVAFNMEALRAAGWWDTFFPQYCSDVDYYWRLLLAGYDHINSGLGVKHHNDGASTMKSDPYRRFLHDVTYPIYEKYFVKKWGKPWVYPDDLAFAKKWHRTPFNLGVGAERR
jgi:GT2 family glycosyltransferase